MLIPLDLYYPEVTPMERVADRILSIRGHRVMVGEAAAWIGY